jgi:hypothetical protein
MTDEQKQSQKWNEELREIVKEEETKIIVKVLKDIFDKDKKND